MGAQPLESVDVDWNGFAGDRRWAFIRGDLVRSGFPWLTIRENQKMWQYMPHFVEPDRPDASVTMVTSPSGRDFDVVDPALAEELGHNARVIKQDRGVFDAFPLSLLTVQSVAALGASVGYELDKRRFRENLYLDLNSAESFAEDAFVGRRLRIGARLTVHILERDIRCRMIGIDPETLEENPDILRYVAKSHDNTAGVYAAVLVAGLVRPGDEIVLED